jgi:trehalose transport system permease protein
MINRSLTRISFYIVFAIIMIYTFFPLYVLILIAFTPPIHTPVASLHPTLYPSGFTLSSLLGAFAIPEIFAAFTKSLEVAFIVAGLALLIGVPAAYGLSRLHPKIANSISTLLFFANMLPSITIAIPISVTFLKLGLSETPIALALAQELIVLPLSVFFLLGAFQSVPKDLINQARVDGAGLFRTIFTIIVPLAKAGVAATFLLSWMLSWDEFTFAVFLSPAKPTLPILIYIYITRGSILDASAFSILVTVPVVVLVVILSRFLRGELLQGGING